MLAKIKDSVASFYTAKTENRGGVIGKKHWIQVARKDGRLIVMISISYQSVSFRYMNINSYSINR